ncbi:hypothetical protein DPMN_102667 [Dreissena polymorpha]|uniref:Uncharacterized protein n=1 Tax=Dreissena polymorpha TaxID=45954 RepID=A0A9D4R9A8_DREPO|nr:hypothetical protein DPMN_102667 [Dreissena polymorpha]
MDKVKDTIAFLNPGQVVILTADQLLYALAKQIQWRWPDKFGEDKIVMMFGGLQIEMAALNYRNVFASKWMDGRPYRS